MSSSSESDDPLAALLGADRVLAREKRRLSDSSADFAVDVPRIFQTVGRRNLELARNHERLQRELDHNRRQALEQIDAAARERNVLARELENECVDVDARVEQLLQECKNEPLLLERHLYVFDGCASEGHDDGGVGADGFYVFSDDISDPKLENLLSIDFLQTALQCNNVRTLRQQNRLLQLAIGRGLHVHETLALAFLLGRLSLFEHQLSSDCLTFKLFHKNTNILADLLKTKLYLAAHAIFELTETPLDLYRLFFLVINDHNVVQFWFNEMLTEFVDVFPILVSSMPVDTPTLARSLVTMCRVQLAGTSGRFAWRKYEFSLLYTTIFILQLAFVQRPAVPRSTSRLVRDLTRAVVGKSVGDILKDALEFMNSDFHNMFENFSQVNELYRLDFELKMINFISDDPLPKHTKLLFRLKELYHAKLGDISFLACGLDKVLIKQQLVKLLGNDYEILNYLHQKHIQFASVGEDLFYG